MDIEEVADLFKVEIIGVGDDQSLVGNVLDELSPELLVGHVLGYQTDTDLRELLVVEGADILADPGKEFLLEK